MKNIVITVLAVLNIIVIIYLVSLIKTNEETISKLASCNAEANRHERNAKIALANARKQSLEKEYAEELL